ncbi:MAG: FecR domain-containing protein [Pseudomonadota bacterium]
MAKPDPRNVRLVEEATDLFLRMQDDPTDQRLIAERADFLARGETEQQIWKNVLKAWKGAGARRGPKSSLMIACIAFLAGVIYLSAGPLRTAYLADHSAGSGPKQVMLSSGDIADLDASSAIIDDTDGAERRVEVLDGAAFFDVGSASKPFVADLGALSIRVVGTAFETAWLGDAVSVSVAEGRVEVQSSDQTWTLASGDRLRWSGDGGGALDRVDPADVASWRGGPFIADGVTFKYATSVIDRRLPGRVVVIGDALARSEVVGVIDLSDPLLALRTLAAARSATLIAMPPFVTLVYAD